MAGSSALRTRFLLAFFIALAFVLRFSGAPAQDMFGDEAAEAFRAIGFLDYLGTSFQTQPVEWYNGKPLPAWTKLSFHDHPPFSFLLRHVFFRVFGDTIFVARLPSILLGTVAVYLLYALVRREEEDEPTALFAALLFAISGAMVFLFRTSLIEPVLLFIIIVNLICFFAFVKDARRWWLFGVSLGLAALTKYTAVFLVPTFIAYLLFVKRAAFRDWRLYASAGLALVLFSPVVVYNGFLYAARGHFDLQIAYLLGQPTPEWQGLLGKTQDPFSRILPQSVAAFGWLLLAVSLAGAVAAFASYRRARRSPLTLFFALYAVFLTLMLFVVGSGTRFLLLYAPAFIFFAAVLSRCLWCAVRYRHLGKLLVAAFLLAEGGVAVHRNIINAPDYGIAKLDRFFEEEFRGKESAVIPSADNTHLTEVIHSFAARKNPKAGAMYTMIVYNDNIELPTLLWVFDRRFFYHSIPVMYVENFTSLFAARGPEFFKGFQIYFVESTEYSLLNPFKREKTAGKEFERSLVAQGARPVASIRGRDGKEMFRIYRFSI